MKIVDVDLIILLHEEIDRCELCNAAGKLEVHHIFPRGMGGGGRLDIPWNLLVVCRDCHQHCQAGKIPKREQLGIAAEREIWRLKRT